MLLNEIFYKLSDFIKNLDQAVDLQTQIKYKGYLSIPYSKF